MAEFYVRNSLGYKVTVKFNITLRFIVPLGERGDHKWVLEIGSTHPAADGSTLPSRKVHNVSTTNLDKIIEEKTAELCALIDWTPLAVDKEAPYIDSALPNGSDINIGSNVYITIKDLLPSAGIDLSGMKVTLNNSMTDFDITTEVVEVDEYYSEYTLKWETPLRVYSRYE